MLKYQIHNQTYIPKFLHSKSDRKNRETFSNFWKVAEVRRTAISCLGSGAKNELSPEPNGAGSENHSVPFYTLSDALENQIVPICPLCFEPINPNL